MNRVLGTILLFGSLIQPVSADHPNAKFHAMCSTYALAYEMQTWHQKDWFMIMQTLRTRSSRMGYVTELKESIDLYLKPLVTSHRDVLVHQLKGCLVMMNRIEPAVEVHF